MNRLLPLVLITACADAPSPEVDEALRVARPHLYAGNVVEGGTLSVVVRLAPPGAEVTVRGSAVGLGAGCTPRSATSCTPLRRSMVLGTGTVGVDGTASVAVPVPRAIAADQVWIDAEVSLSGRFARTLPEMRLVQSSPPDLIALCDPATLPSDSRVLANTFINGDTLFVDVSYGGGCAAHELPACWDGLFRESFPVQADVVIGHEGNGDPCDAWITETRRYDLAVLRDGYQAGYGAIGTISTFVDAESLVYGF